MSTYTRQSVAVLLLTLGVSILAYQMGEIVTIMNEREEPIGKLEPLADKPRDPLRVRFSYSRFMVRHDLKTADGKIVCGIAVTSWKEAKGTAVAVFVLVPKDDVPNVFYDADQVDKTKRRELTTFVLTAGQTKHVDEMKSLGVQPWVIKLERSTAH